MLDTCESRVKDLQSYRLHIAGMNARQMECLVDLSFLMRELFHLLHLFKLNTMTHLYTYDSDKLLTFGLFHICNFA